jgi:hypothetical protein
MKPGIVAWQVGIKASGVNQMKESCLLLSISNQSFVNERYQPLHYHISQNLEYKEKLLKPLNPLLCEEASCPHKLCLCSF